MPSAAGATCRRHIVRAARCASPSCRRTPRLNRVRPRRSVMSARIEVAGLRIDKILYDFVAAEVLPDTQISVEAFWTGLAAIMRDLAPRNRELLAWRDALQAGIDEYQRIHCGTPLDQREYERFLRKI